MTDNRQVMEDAQAIIHIGMPKTATTFMDKAFFPKHPEVIYGGLGGDEYKVTFLRVLRRRDRFNAEDFQEEIRRLEDAARATSKRIVISDELIGASVPGDLPYRTKAERLRELFPNARIIMTIRHPLALLKSQYTNYLSSWEANKGRERLRSLDEQLLELKKQGSFQRIWFVPVFNTYADLFGAENICVLCYEDFKRNKEHFAQQLASFCGLSPDKTRELLAAPPVHQSLSGEQRAALQAMDALPVGTDLAKTLRRLAPAPVRKLVKRVLVKPDQGNGLSFSDSSISLIRAEFKEHNQVPPGPMQEIFDRYGYFD